MVGLEEGSNQIIPLSHLRGEIVAEAVCNKVFENVLAASSVGRMKVSSTLALSYE